MRKKREFNRLEEGGWYAEASVGHFGGIYYLAPGNVPRFIDALGPFRTFGEAKADAIAYFRTDVDLAFEAIRAIRACRKPKGGGR